MSVRIIVRSTMFNCMYFGFIFFQVSVIPRSSFCSSSGGPKKMGPARMGKDYLPVGVTKMSPAWQEWFYNWQESPVFVSSFRYTHLHLFCALFGCQGNSRVFSLQSFIFYYQYVQSGGTVPISVLSEEYREILLEVCSRFIFILSEKGLATISTSLTWDNSSSHVIYLVMDTELWHSSNLLGIHGVCVLRGEESRSLALGPGNDDSSSVRLLNNAFQPARRDVERYLNSQPLYINLAMSRWLLKEVLLPPAKLSEEKLRSYPGLRALDPSTVELMSLGLMALVELTQEGKVPFYIKYTQDFRGCITPSDVFMKALMDSPITLPVFQFSSDTELAWSAPASTLGLINLHMAMGYRRPGLEVSRDILTLFDKRTSLDSRCFWINKFYKINDRLPLMQIYARNGLFDHFHLLFCLNPPVPVEGMRGQTGKGLFTWLLFSWAVLLTPEECKLVMGLNNWMLREQGCHLDSHWMGRLVYLMLGGGDQQKMLEAALQGYDGSDEVLRSALTVKVKEALEQLHPGWADYVSVFNSFCDIPKGSHPSLGFTFPEDGFVVDLMERDSLYSSYTLEWGGKREDFYVWLPTDSPCQIKTTEFGLINTLYSFESYFMASLIRTLGKGYKVLPVGSSFLITLEDYGDVSEFPSEVFTTIYGTKPLLRVVGELNKGFMVDEDGDAHSESSLRRYHEVSPRESYGDKEWYSKVDNMVDLRQRLFKTFLIEWHPNSYKARVGVTEVAEEGPFWDPNA